MPRNTELTGAAVIYVRLAVRVTYWLLLKVTTACMTLKARPVIGTWLNVRVVLSGEAVHIVCKVTPFFATLKV